MMPRRKMPRRTGRVPAAIALAMAATIVLACACGGRRPERAAPSADPGTDAITVLLPGMPQPVVLVDGQGEYTIIPGSATRGRIRALPGMTARWQRGESADAAMVVALSPGGTGTFLYLVLFDATGDHLTQRDSAFLGDRIVVRRIGIGELVHDPEADYRISVRTLVRRDGEPMSTPPTVARTRTFYVTRQHLEEVAVGRDDS